MGTRRLRNGTPRNTRARTHRNGTPRKYLVPESGHGESGPGLLPLQAFGVSGSRGWIHSGAALWRSARAGRRMAGSWGQPDSACQERWAEPPSERPSLWAASIQDSEFLSISHASSCLPLNCPRIDFKQTLCFLFIRPLPHLVANLKGLGLCSWSLRWSRKHRIVSRPPDKTFHVTLGSSSLSTDTLSCYLWVELSPGWLSEVACFHFLLLLFFLYWISILSDSKCWY